MLNEDLINYPVMQHWKTAVTAAQKKDLPVFAREVTKAVEYMVTEAKKRSYGPGRAEVNIKFLGECIVAFGENRNEFLSQLESCIGNYRLLSRVEVWGIFEDIVLPLTNFLYQNYGASGIPAYFATFPVKGPALFPYTEENYIKVCSAVSAPIRQRPISHPPCRLLSPKSRVLLTSGFNLRDNAGWKLVANTANALQKNNAAEIQYDIIGIGKKDLSINDRLIRGIKKFNLRDLLSYDLVVISGFAIFEPILFREHLPNIALHTFNFDWSPVDAEILFSSTPPTDGSLTKQVRGQRWDLLPSVFPLNGHEIPHSGTTIAFGTFGRPEKIADPKFLTIVRQILDQVPGARFHWCAAAKGMPAPTYMQELLSEAGILDRSIFRGWVSADDFARDVDVHLESFPFGTATAAFDLLARGRPTVSLRGHLTTHALIWNPLMISGFGDPVAAATARARMRLDTDQSLWLEARDEQEYIALAVRLAKDTAWRRQAWLAYRDLAAPLATGRHVATAFVAALNAFRERS